MCIELRIKITLIRRIVVDILLDKPLAEANYEERLQICKNCEYFLGVNSVDIQLVAFALQYDNTILKAIESGDKRGIELDNLQPKW